MKNHFYSHLIEIETLYEELGALDLEEQEHEELITIVHTTIHHTVVDTVLTELSDEDKKLFLHHLAHAHHEELWDHVKGKIENVEEKIKTTVQDLVQSLHEDITEIKEKH